MDKYLFSKDNKEERIYIIQESEKERIEKNKILFEKEIEKLPKIDKFYIVIGLGGVGSKVVMDLIRAGVQKIKVIDYDLVTLSSLNRMLLQKEVM